LPRPARDQAREQLSIALEVQERNGERRGYPVSVADLDAIIALYDDYDAALGEPLQGANLDAALRTAVQRCYELTQRGRRLAAIRATLMRGVEQCPICGISPPRVLDHHLPKSVYQPLAIYVRNLVPLCVDCNQSKGTAASANPAERFVHPYLEQLPDARFLRASVTIENNDLIAEFGLDPAAHLPEFLRARLDHQLRRLHLNARYAQEINTYLAGHATGLHMCFEALGPEGVRRYLEAQAGVEFHQFHRNHWRPVLLLALANHEEFCAGAHRDLVPPVPTADLPLAPQAEVAG
jgi:5-methylcytosine-specific restriction endonuclease McrA